MRRRTQRGNALLEFTLAGITFIFIWINIVQIAIGMWQYHTMQFAVKKAGDYITFHGSNCSTGGNSCSIQIKDVAQLLKNYAIGIDPSVLTVTFNVMASDHVTVVSGQTITCQLSGGGSPCLNKATTWPPSSYNTPGTDIEIKTEYPFQSTFGRFWLPAFTHQTILF